MLRTTNPVGSGRRIYIVMGNTESLAEFLETKRSRLVKQWLDVLLDSYSQQAAEFMRAQKNRFDNPVGNNMRRALEMLYDNLRGGFDPMEAAEPLDGIVRVRAIQDFMPSDSLAFIMQLKEVIASALGPSASREDIAPDLAKLTHDIDRMAFLAFDLYVGCRNQLAEIRVKEIERHNHMAWRRAGFLNDDQADQPVKTGG